MGESVIDGMGPRRTEAKRLLRPGVLKANVTKDRSFERQSAGGGGFYVATKERPLQREAWT